MTAVEALRKARAGACAHDLPGGEEDPGHDACASALLDGFTCAELTRAERKLER